MKAADELAKHVGVKPACAALEVSRSTLYRRRGPSTGQPFTLYMTASGGNKLPYGNLPRWAATQNNLDNAIQILRVTPSQATTGVFRNE